MLNRERNAYLLDAVAALPERLQVVVQGYFFDERPMAQIAAELGVTESRISQMRAEALAMLKDGMTAMLNPDEVASDDQARRLCGPTQGGLLRGNRSQLGLSRPRQQFGHRARDERPALPSTLLLDHSSESPRLSRSRAFVSQVVALLAEREIGRSSGQLGDWVRHPPEHTGRERSSAQ